MKSQIHVKIKEKKVFYNQQTNLSKESYILILDFFKKPRYQILQGLKVEYKKGLDF